MLVASSARSPFVGVGGGVPAAVLLRQRIAQAEANVKNLVGATKLISVKCKEEEMKMT